MNAQTTEVVRHEPQFEEKKPLADQDTFRHNRRLEGLSTEKKKKKKGKKSSAIRSEMSMFHASSFLFTSLLLGFFLI